MEECVKTTSQARCCYLKALYSTSRRWRFFNLYAGHVWIYLISFLSLILAFYVINIDEFIMSGSRMDNITNFAEAAIHATTWGAIGGILRGLWYLKDKVSERKYKNSFGPYFLSVPFLGAIFGAVVYLIIVAGLLSLGTGQSDDQQLPQINRPLVIIPICAIAGFNWEWVVIIFQRIEEADFLKISRVNSFLVLHNLNVNLANNLFRRRLYNLFASIKNLINTARIAAVLVWLSMSLYILSGTYIEVIHNIVNGNIDTQSLIPQLIVLILDLVGGPYILLRFLPNLIGRIMLHEIRKYLHF